MEDKGHTGSAPEGQQTNPEEHNRKRIFTQTLQLSTSTVVNQGARFVKNVLLAAMLGPALFGLWNALQALITYGLNSHLGILQAMTREIPMSQGSGKQDIAPRIANTGFTFSLLSSVGGGILVAIGGYYYASAEDIGLAVALLLIPSIVSQMGFLFGQSLLRALDEFGSLSRLLSIVSVLELGATIGFVALMGFNGILLALILTHAVGTLLCVVHRWEFSLRLELDWELVKDLLRPGFPIMLTTLGYFVFLTLDRILIISIAGSESLGYYALGSLAIIAIRYVPMAINQVMYPKFALRYGTTKDPLTLTGYLRVTTLVTAHAMGLVLGAAVLLLPLVTIFLPEYTPGVEAASILLAGFYFVSFTGSSGNLLLTINRQIEYLMFQLGAILITGGAVTFVLLSGFGIEGVAIATAGTYFLFSFGLIRFTVGKYLAPGSHPFGPGLYKLCIPWIAAVALVVLAVGVNAGNIWVTVTIRVLLFGLIYVPLGGWILKREKIW